METTIFYIISVIILVFSVLTVTTTKILRAAVYLLFTLVATAAFYFMMEYNFLAAVQLTVYAGGIVVLIIFSILLTHQINTNLDKINVKKIALGIISSGLGIFLVLSTLNNFEFAEPKNPATDSSIHGITPEDTENAPRIHEVWDEVAEFIGNRTLVAHNAAFDMSVLRKSFAIRKSPVPHEYEYLCTYLLARSVWPTRWSYRLNDIIIARRKKEWNV